MAKIVQCRHTFQITRPECKACNGQRKSCPQYVEERPELAAPKAAGQKGETL